MQHKHDVNVPNEIGVVLLAAGASRRMHTAKQLLRIDGQSLIRRSVTAALDSKCRPVVVVLGAHVEQIRPEIVGLPVHIVENCGWQEGIASSIRAGLTKLMESAAAITAAVFHVCDQPAVTGAVLDALVDAHRNSRKRIVASQYAGCLGVPALFESTLFPELMGLQGDTGAKLVLAKHASEAVALPFSCGAYDLDTPIDVRRMTLSTSRVDGLSTYEELPDD